MEHTITEKELKEIATQLSCPDGKKGIEMAAMMNDTNAGMISESIKTLQLQDQNSMLELGHGNCGHLTKVLKQAKNIRYFGLEISKTMKQEAERINNEILTKNQIEFKLYDGKTIPFPDNSFDRIMTVNTIYFWENQAELLNEIYRVLKPQGFFVLTFAQREFMKKLPFVKYKFTLFNNQEIKDIVNKSNFQLEEILEKTEKIKNKNGESDNRKFSVAKMVKEGNIYARMNYI